MASAFFQLPASAFFQLPARAFFQLPARAFTGRCTQKSKNPYQNLPYLPFIKLNQDLVFDAVW